MVQIRMSSREHRRRRAAGDRGRLAAEFENGRRPACRSSESWNGSRGWVGWLHVSVRSGAALHLCPVQRPLPSAPSGRPSLGPDGTPPPVYTGGPRAPSGCDPGVRVEAVLSRSKGQSVAEVAVHVPRSSRIPVCGSPPAALCPRPAVNRPDINDVRCTAPFGPVEPCPACPLPEVELIRRSRLDLCRRIGRSASSSMSSSPW